MLIVGRGRGELTQAFISMTLFGREGEVNSFIPPPLHTYQVTKLWDSSEVESFRIERQSLSLAINFSNNQT